VKEMPHPQKDGLGAAKPFDRAEFDAFQTALASFGDRELLGLKRRVFDGVTSEDSLGTVPVSQSRFARGVIRVALRQRHALNGPSPSLSQWRQEYDLSEPARGHDGC
jgi:hypothetical protein